MNSKLSEQKTEKHEIQILHCGKKLKAGENRMSAESSWVHNVARGQKDIAGHQCAKLLIEGQGGKFRPLNVITKSVPNIVFFRCTVNS